MNTDVYDFPFYFGENGNKFAKFIQTY